MTEIFIEPELANLENADVAAEWFETCSRLGLSEQLRHADRSDEKKAPPYMFIDAKTDRIIVTVCPRVVDYKKYSASTIPLDVLQEIDKCEKNGWYKEIKICYDDKTPDPFVVGICHKDEKGWGPINKHLIARWGAELVPFEVLEQRAVTRIKKVAYKELLKHKAEIDAYAANPEILAQGVIDGMNMPVMSINVGSTYYGGSLPF